MVVILLPAFLIPSDGDITGAKGEGDYWVVKLSSSGSVVWKQNYGGSGNDNLHSHYFQSFTNEYYLAGDSDSGDGDFTEDFGDVDFGIIKFKDPHFANQRFNGM